MEEVIESSWDGLCRAGERERARTFTGEPLTPGYNADRIEIAAGIAMLDGQLGNTSTETRTVIQYALQRHARGEEAAAQRGATDLSFHGIGYGGWCMVLAAAMAGGKQ